MFNPKALTSPGVKDLTSGLEPIIPKSASCSAAMDDATGVPSPFVFEHMTENIPPVDLDPPDVDNDDMYEEEDSAEATVGPDLLDITLEQRLELLGLCASLNTDINAIAIQGLDFQQDFTLGFNVNNTTTITNMLSSLLIKDDEIDWDKSTRRITQHGFISDNSNNKTVSAIIYLHIFVSTRPQGPCRIINYESGHTQQAHWKSYATGLCLDPAVNFKWIYAGSIGPVPKNNQFMALCKNQLEFYAGYQQIHLAVWPDAVKLTLSATNTITSRLTFLNLYVGIDHELDQTEIGDSSSYRRSSSVPASMALFGLSNRPTISEILGHKVMKCSNYLSGKELVVFEPKSSHVESTYVTVHMESLLKYLWTEGLGIFIRGAVITAELKQDLGYKIRILLNHNSRGTESIIAALLRIPNTLARKTEARIPADEWGLRDLTNLYSELRRPIKNKGKSLSGSGGRGDTKTNKGRGRGNGPGPGLPLFPQSYSRATSSSTMEPQLDLVRHNNLQNSINFLKEKCSAQETQIVEMRSEHAQILRSIEERSELIMVAQSEFTREQDAQRNILDLQSREQEEQRNILLQQGTAIADTKALALDARQGLHNLSTIMANLAATQQALGEIMSGLSPSPPITNGIGTTEEPGPKYPKPN
jgi:hypothetical protein